MNATNPLAEVKATLALCDLNRRERLLKIIRGKPAWVYYASGVLWCILIIYAKHAERADNDSAYVWSVLGPLGLMIIGTYWNLSQRMNALIELIGEEHLRRPKTDDEEQNA